MPVQRAIVEELEKKHTLGFWDRKGFPDTTEANRGGAEGAAVTVSALVLLYSVCIRKRNQL